MNPVNLDLPSNSEVYNFLYSERDSEYLVQDVLTVRLPNGVCIDVGWYPEHDLNGEYLLRVFWEDWSTQFGPQIRTNDINELISTVEFLAHQYSRSRMCVSSSDSGSFESEYATS